MRLALSTAPAADAVTIAEARDWLNFVPGVAADDGVLETLIDEVYDYLESRLNRKLCTQTWKIYLDEGEVLSDIRLPLVPLVSVSSISATDSDGTASTVTSTNYQVIVGENPRLSLAEDGEWPTDFRDYECLEITAVVGYNGNKATYVGFKPYEVTMSGLNDLRASIGTYTGTAKTTFELEITATNLTSGDPSTTADVFKWRKVTKNADGVKTNGAWTADVKITGAAQTLADGISVTFDALVGHSQGDAWTVQVYEVLPRRVKMLLKGLILHFYATKGRGVMETVSGQLIGTPRILDYMIESLRVVPL